MQRADSLEKTDAGKDWRQKEKEMTEVEMVEYYRLSGHEFEKTPGNSEGQGSLAYGIAKSWMWYNDWATNEQKVSVWKIIHKCSHQKYTKDIFSKLRIIFYISHLLLNN